MHGFYFYLFVSARKGQRFDTQSFWQGCFSNSKNTCYFYSGQPTLPTKNDNIKAFYDQSIATTTMNVSLSIVCPGVLFQKSEVAKIL